MFIRRNEFNQFTLFESISSLRHTKGSHFWVKTHHSLKRCIYWIGWMLKYSYLSCQCTLFPIHIRCYHDENPYLIIYCTKATAFRRYGEWRILFVIKWTMASFHWIEPLRALGRKYFWNIIQNIDCLLSSSILSMIYHAHRPNTHFVHFCFCAFT